MKLIILLFVVLIIAVAWFIKFLMDRRYSAYREYLKEIMMDTKGNPTYPKPPPPSPPPPPKNWPRW